jgi:hypothetical protein
VFLCSVTPETSCQLGFQGDRPDASLHSAFMLLKMYYIENADNSWGEIIF